MSEPSQARPGPGSVSPPRRSAARNAERRCLTQNDQPPVSCPACGSPMRLWANYHRCGNCGFKESCCF